MRLPRMTTRRWMIAVAIVALSLGASRYAAMLKRQRDSYLARATWHSSMEADALRMLGGPFNRPEPAPAPITGGERITAIRLLGGLRTEELNRDQDDHYRVDQQEREYAIAASRRRILAEFRGKDLGYYRKQADYHAALTEKYRNAARFPWLRVEPDPPAPE